MNYPFRDLLFTIAKVFHVNVFEIMEYIIHNGYIIFKPLIMFLQASKLAFIDCEIKQDGFQAYLPPEQFVHNQPLNKSQTIELKLPVFLVLLGYRVGSQFSGYELDFEIELIMKGEKINYRQIRQGKLGRNYIFKQIEVDSCHLYQKPITCLIKIKYTENQNKQFCSVEELSKLLSNRSYVIYSEKTISTIKREIMIKEPVQITCREKKASGKAPAYLYLKCTNTSDYEIKIKKIELLEQVNQKHSIEQIESGAENEWLKSLNCAQKLLKKNEEIGLLLIKKNGPRFPTPLMIQYESSQRPGQIFKIIRNVEP